MLTLFDLLLQDLKALFEARNKVSGKVDMQKSFYFMKELGHDVPFKFRWSDLGPYSHELANVLDRLTVQRYIKYDGNYEMIERSFKYVQPNTSPRLEKFFATLENICDEKKFNIVYFIECAASLHFIYEYTRTRRKEDAFKKLKMLKPDRMPHFDPLMNEAWDFLKGQGLVA